MSEKIAILQVADTGPLESLVEMLRTDGWLCCLPSDQLKAELRGIGCDTVLDVRALVEHWGYDPPMSLPVAGTAAMSMSQNLYVDVKAHRSYPKVVARWPAMTGRVLWYRINGGKPEHVVNARGDMGDEVDPPCPVLTPNQWYANPELFCSMQDLLVPNHRESIQQRAYCCWPPFHRIGDYAAPRRTNYSAPICLVHNLAGWGYGALADPMRAMGVRLLGVGSPDGLVQHRELPRMLSEALCMVHLKSSDAPGYAIYEALAAGCPVVCTRRLIWRCRMGELLVPDETCLVFDRETHDALTDKDVASCTAEVASHLERLRDPAENQRIGSAGRERLRQLLWDERRGGESLRRFMALNFGGGR